MYFNGALLHHTFAYARRVLLTQFLYFKTFYSVVHTETQCDVGPILPTRSLFDS